MISVINLGLGPEIILFHTMTNDMIMELYLKSLHQFERDIRGYSTIFIIAQSCLGSVAAMYILVNGVSPLQMFQLFLVTIVCMGFNAAVLSQRKPKTIFNLFLISMVLSSVVLILNLL
ncbi:hypothetical protein [Flagellimonas flava]|uniref:Uncharacterized protein n=1 Tax=Flagellimonas flava TaxID=570519 RepID=A0A1M5N553_9FLAO|nr:hypothetical protein [Allomuricauda flava]SHG84309.1 hypothetical protein SAMN04488116_2647 [Allomuricauda flava]